jgi:SAM-dependent methyltransferase
MATVSEECILGLYAPPGVKFDEQHPLEYPLPEPSSSNFGPEVLESPQPSTSQSYDAVAVEYTTRLFEELRHKPFDRAQLDRLVERTRGLGPICDLGCGPGQVARYLHDRGAPVLGVDLSPGMLEQARRLNPEIEFCLGDILDLPVAAEAWGGIAAFYSLIHIPREKIVEALGELRRVLVPGGWLLAAFHLGKETLHRDELWGQPLALDFHFFETGEMSKWLETAGFRSIEAREREPYAPEVEHQSRRGYVFAQKPG